MNIEKLEQEAADIASKIEHIKKINAVLESNDVDSNIGMLKAIREILTFTKNIEKDFALIESYITKDVLLDEEPEIDMSYTITGSSWLKFATYEVEDGELRLFTKDDAEITRYGVPIGLWVDFVDACEKGESAGRFYHSDIKPFYVS